MKESRKQARTRIDHERDAANASWDALQKTTVHRVKEEIDQKMKIWAPGRAAVKGKVELILDNNVLVTDKRRVTPQSVEKAFQEKQEALRAPLNPSEQLRAIDNLHAALYPAVKEAENRRNRSNVSDEVRQQIADMRGDEQALYRIKQMVKGERDAHETRSTTGKTIAERLDAVVGNYGQLIPDNFNDKGTQVYIASTGGTVHPDESGQIHNTGYNGGILYQFASARQIWNELETNPQMIREQVLDLPEGHLADTAWITEQPVVLQPQDMVRKTAA